MQAEAVGLMRTGTSIIPLVYDFERNLIVTVQIAIKEIKQLANLEVKRGWNIRCLHVAGVTRWPVEL